MERARTVQVSLGLHVDGSTLAVVKSSHGTIMPSAERFLTLRQALLEGVVEGFCVEPRRIALVLFGGRKQLWTYARI